MFSDILQGIGTVMDTPRRLLYAGGNAAARGLGYQGKDVNHFSDLLGMIPGMEGEGPLKSILGFAGDVATDPMTYASGLGMKFLRGRIPGYVEKASLPESKMLAAAGENVAADLPGSLSQGTLGAANKFKGPLENTTAMRNLEQFPPGVMPYEGQIAGPATSTGRIGGDLLRTPAGGSMSEVKSALGNMHGNTPDGLLGQVGGLYDSPSGVYGTVPGGTARELRHERVHAIIDQAAKGNGDVNALPALMRYPAKLLSSKSDTLWDIGRVGDELAAQALENRGLGNQLQGAMGFLFHPQKNAEYANRYLAGGMNPYVAKTYGALPTAFVGSGPATTTLARAIGGY